MRRPKVKLHVEQTPRTERGSFAYITVKAVNTTHYWVGQLLTKRDVDDAIGRDVNVIITREDRR